MKFTTAAITATAAALVSASPVQVNTSDKIQDGDVFTLLALRSASEIHYAKVQAANSGLLINTPAQNASCSEPTDYASFQLFNGNLYLYTQNPPQQIFVDRSGMGQGLIGYTTGAQPIGRNQERTSFAINDDNQLVFRDQSGRDTGLLACPNASPAGWSVWLAGVDNPGGNSGCVGFGALAVKSNEPVFCSYTS